jgi:hypothetical protein
MAKSRSESSQVLEDSALIGLALQRPPDQRRLITAGESMTHTMMRRLCQKGGNNFFA